jgi:single-strand DNA-binding protein
MGSVNTVAVSGRATRDPELKTFGEDGKVASFGIASDRTIKQGDEYVQVPNFFDVSVFGGYAALIDKKLRKGDLITIQGELRYETWENEAGEKRSKVSIIAKTVDGEYAFRKADGSDTPGRDSGDGPGDQGELPGTDPAKSDIPF